MDVREENGLETAGQMEPKKEGMFSQILISVVQKFIVLGSQYELVMGKTPRCQYFDTHVISEGRKSHGKKE